MSHDHALQPEYAAAIDYALTRLTRELPPWLTYHSLAHTRDDVLPAADRIAALNGVTGTALHLLQVAAAFHDVGFIEQYDDHEIAGIRIAWTTLPHFGFPAQGIHAIAGMIAATRLPQWPHTDLEALLADADLDSLGRDDFVMTSLALRVELAARGQPSNEEAWWATQLTFLKTHRYWTAGAQQLRTAGQQRNIELVSTLLYNSNWHASTK